MRCPSCMAENAVTRRFCAECGAPLPSRCSACGFENEPTAKFCGGCGKPLAEIANAIPPASSPPARIDGAERRHLTVMFCDLVGATALASRLDPGDLREVIGAYHKCVAETIGQFDGFVAKYMGDGVLAYFGYPRAHEDDAERTIRRPSRSLPGQACPGAAEGSRSDADPGSRSPPDWIKAQRQVTGPSLEPGPRFLSDQESWGPAPGGWEA